MHDSKTYFKATKIAGHLLQILNQHPVEKEEEFERWIHENETAGNLLSELSDPDRLSYLATSFKQTEQEKEARKLILRINRYKRQRQIIRISTIAASLLLATCLFTYHYRKTSTEQNSNIFANQPVLTLSNGECIPLDSIAAGKSFRIDGTEIKQSAQKQITYSSTGISGNTKDSPSYNILQIPKQCNYNVILADGTIVHLNASSQLRYPTRFNGKERKVYLDGEAYFEVQKDSIPFIVSAKQAQIQVYGTKFNVSTYTPDQVTTVLTEGIVGVSFNKNGLVTQEQILRPNQLSRLDLNTGKQEILETEVEKYISWTYGYFRYDQDRLEDLIRDLSQWYGIYFEYTDTQLKELKISASVNKDLSLENVLTLISNTTKIRFLKTERGYQIISQ